MNENIYNILSTKDLEKSLKAKYLTRTYEKQVILHEL